MLFVVCLRMVEQFSDNSNPVYQSLDHHTTTYTNKQNMIMHNQARTEKSRDNINFLA